MIGILNVRKICTIKSEFQKRKYQKFCEKSNHFSKGRQLKSVTSLHLTGEVEKGLKCCAACDPSNEPAHEIMALFVLSKLILQTRMRGHPVGLDVWFLVGPFVYIHTSCVRTAKALVRLCRCAGSPEPSLVTCVISTIISWAGSNALCSHSVGSERLLFAISFPLVPYIVCANSKGSG